MKALVVHMAHFRLPDNFNGSVSDAFRLLADYHESVDNTQIQSKEELPSDCGDKIGEMTVRQASTAIFDKFMEGVMTGRRFVGLVQLADYDPKINLEVVQ